jgi:acyl dehydratase
VSLIVEDLASLKTYEGSDLGWSDWVEVTQERIDLFAEATGDFQWIHTDPSRAAQESPYGSTIAHGYLTLALVPVAVGQLFQVRNKRFGLNYGAERLRFPAPVPVGSKLRAHGKLVEVQETGAGYQVRIDVTVVIDGADKPACAVQLVYRYFP